jgi:NADH-quinone oxidoreductase subunit H
MLNYINCILFVTLNTAIIILFILLGGILPLIERKFLSLTHRRVGPKFAGFKGRFQFIADAIKLLIKEFFLPKTTSKFFFYTTPIFLLNINLFLVLNMV